MVVRGADSPPSADFFMTGLQEHQARPGQLRAAEYHRQLGPVVAEHTVQMIGTRLGGSVEDARQATLQRLVDGVEAGEIDPEMADFAREELSLADR